MKRPDIYVFDDSFSALDFRTDARLRAALGRELGEATVIIVAQRVGTILHADRIVVLDDGRGRRHRHPRRAHADLRDLPRDRPVPGHRGGGRMSGATPRPAQAPGGAAGGPTARAVSATGLARLRPPHMAMMMPTAKPVRFGQSFRRLLGELRPEPLADPRRASLLAVVSVFLAVLGPKLLGEATNVIFAGVVGPADPGVAGMTNEQVVDALQRRGPDEPGGDAREHARRRARPGHRLHAARPDPRRSSAVVYIAQLAVRVGPGLHHGRRHPADRVPAARARRPEARAAAARLLRPRAPRRHPVAASPTTSTTSARRSSRA